MAFATSQVGFGNSGDMNVLRGKFTASVGDADGTITVGGALIGDARFWDGSKTTPSQSEFPFTMSTNTTTGITTFTVNVSRGATNGRFIIRYR